MINVLALTAILALSTCVAAQTTRKVFPIPEFKAVGIGDETLLLIPCMSCRWNAWEEFMERNQQKYTMYAVTIPGFGGTSVPDLPPNTDKTPWRENALDALSQFINEHKLRNVTIVGHSWGTMIGVQLAVRRHDVVKRLISVDGFIESTSWIPPDPQDRLPAAKQIIEVWSARFEDAEQWRVFNIASLPRGESVSRKRAVQALKIHGSFMATSKNALLQYWRENVLVDLTKDLRSLRIPVLDIKCLQEPINSPGPSQSEQAKAHLGTLKKAQAPPQIKTIFFYNTEHFIMFQRPNELDNVMSDYLVGKHVTDFINN